METRQTTDIETNNTINNNESIFSTEDFLLVNHLLFFKQKTNENENKILLHELYAKTKIQSFILNKYNIIECFDLFNTLENYDSALQPSIQSILWAITFGDKNVIGFRRENDSSLIAFAFYNMIDQNNATIRFILADKKYEFQYILSAIILEEIFQQLEKTTVKKVLVQPVHANDKLSEISQHFNFEKENELVDFYTYSYNSLANRQIRKNLLIKIRDTINEDLINDEMKQSKISIFNLLSTSNANQQEMISRIEGFEFLSKLGLTLFVPGLNEITEYASAHLLALLCPLEPIITLAKNGKFTDKEGQIHYVLSLKDLQSSDHIAVIFYHFKQNENLGYITSLNVDFKNKQRGYGSILLQATLTHLRSLGCDNVKLNSTQEGKYIYLKFGFKPQITDQTTLQDYQKFNNNTERTEFLERNEINSLILDLKDDLNFFKNKSSLESYIKKLHHEPTFEEIGKTKKPKTL